MASPTITILITTYNYGPFLEQAIDSVLAQDFPLEQVQILVVDDGSTDDTRERVKKYGPRVEYFFQVNRGQAAALNLGFSKACGEIICLMDADDLFLPGKLGRIVEAFERDAGLGMAYHRLQEWHTSTDERRSWEFVEVSGDLHKEPEKFALFVPQPTSAVSFRRSFVERLLPIPEEIRMLADCYLVSLIPLLAPVLAIPEFLSVYRIHGKNSYTSMEDDMPIETRRNKLKMWQIVTEAMRKWLEEHGYTRKQRAVKAMTDRWTSFVEREEFTVMAPGRVRFFRYLLQCYRYRYPLMSWRLRAINLSNAVGALFVGYQRFHRLDELREGLTRWLRAPTSKDSSPPPS
ncbi:MAG TPA: glycosyltransferase [Candidatus Acidoferrum sp.]|nr:glycosyltransferase [Candidatus Acidoferrum sp.]